MKAQILILLMVVGIGLMTSCKRDDNDPAPEITINGTWNLKSVRGGLASINREYKKGDVKWIFNETNKTLTVANNIGNDNAYMLPSGTYQYNIDQTGKSQVLLVNNTDYRMVILSIDQNLVISDDMLDGFTGEFNK
ncbi:hypothetical protein H9Q13_15010 [Pontibacter sp. JH31]|uniref:Lipocalin-like domain-containing protein n=1 Tax=Pontibacter aquaedesilientis TaxID=2766980 RepID=A0ABR7XJM6_9BACT|nr:hypothetical protein [Pontibacter aquaedesilientis]MBD1398480.1 hypothetical protein [Pontibacter aquaedesilientis]